MSISLDFRQIYCAQHGISQADYAEHLLKASLPPHARALKGVLEFFYANYLRADYDFLHEVGSLCDYKDYSQSADAFFFHPLNHRGLLRKWLRLRVSTRLLRRQVREHLKQKTTEDAVVIKASPRVKAEIRPASAVGAGNDSILTDQQKTEISSRLYHIASRSAYATHAKPQVERVTSRVLLDAPLKTRELPNRASRMTTSLAFRNTLQNKTVDVLLAMNSKLSDDLDKVTKQRDILREAASMPTNSD
jgi:hypothetical protein